MADSTVPQKPSSPSWQERCARRVEQARDELARVEPALGKVPVKLVEIAMGPSPAAGNPSVVLEAKLRGKGASKWDVAVMVSYQAWILETSQGASQGAWDLDTEKKQWTRLDRGMMTTVLADVPEAARKAVADGFKRAADECVAIAHASGKPR